MADARSIYKDDVDFALLALQSPQFNRHLKPNGQLDFSDPKAVQQLTKSLLKRDFGIEIELPDDRLCPPVPNRLSYIFWIQDLLDTTVDEFSDLNDPDRKVVGLDIGTGSSCIYPLLGCSQRPNWRFVATDIDEKNFQYARQNILSNNLGSRIYPILRKPTDLLIALEPFGLESLDFTICNPPFYSSASDLVASASAKSHPPYSACTGAAIEMVTPGGEVAFVTRMIKESLVLKRKCRWYTSMLGKLSSVQTLLQLLLQECQLKNWAVKEFIHGSKTRRWAIAWTFHKARPTKDVARGIPSLPKSLLPFPSEFAFTIPCHSASSSSLEEYASRLQSLLTNINIQWHYSSSASASASASPSSSSATATSPVTPTIIGYSPGNTWSRAARRKNTRQTQGNQASRKAGDDDDDDDDEEEEENDDTQANQSEKSLRNFGFKIQIRRQHVVTAKNKSGGEEEEEEDEAAAVSNIIIIEVYIRWIWGLDSALFESFYGMLRKNISCCVN